MVVYSSEKNYDFGNLKIHDKHYKKWFL